MNASQLFVVPSAIIAIIGILYVSLDLLPSQNNSENKSYLIKGGIFLIIVYYTSVRIQYGFVAFIVCISLIQLLSLKDELVSSKNQEIFGEYMYSIISQLNQNESPSLQTIPKIIIQIWVQKEGGPAMPKTHTKYVKQMKELNPDYQHLFFDQTDVDQFFTSNYPEYYDTYQRLPVFIQKLDFFRYLAIYHYGGFYFDVDIEPMKPLDDKIVDHHAVFPIDEYIPEVLCNSGRFSPICKKKMNFLLGQYAFGAVPKHPFIKHLVDTIHQNVDMYIQKYKTIQNREVYVYRTTGPDFVSYLYTEYAQKNQIYILSNGKRQMFGDYAVHNYYGSWK